ncbi:MAG: ABC transporter permease [Actinomycetota bacterium]|nr:ABC transporter permease [Actinomycetota bacterium]MDH5224756.1 ABC transporter permease [Actinomycetota bacterium]
MTGVAAPARRARGRVWGPRAVLLGPGVAWWVAFFLIPVGVLIAYSFFRRGPYGGVIYEPTLKNYARAFDSLYIGVLWTSVRIASIATAVSLLLAYPAALFITRAPARWRVPLLVLVILPFWTSFLIRTYAWIVLLNPAGLINKMLIGGGVIDEPLPLLYNEFAVTLGLVYAYLPLMVLPIYASLERLGPQPSEAAADLYATPSQVLRKITIPLTLPGIVAGCIFVFVPSLGNFIVPDLLGGGQTVMIGNVIQQQFLQARDWPFGAVLAMSVIALMVVVLAVQAQVHRRTQEVEHGRAA